MSDTKVFDAFVVLVKAQIDLDPKVDDAGLHFYLKQCGVSVEHIRGYMIEEARKTV